MSASSAKRLTQSMRLLVVEDNAKLAASLKRGLAQEGYAVDTIEDGREALRRLLSSHADYDAVILDIALPGMDGLAICAKLRDTGIMTPVLMLTARDTIPDKILGLDTGADDYVVKPFSFEELLSRVRVLLRRPREGKAPVLTVGSIVLNPATRDVHIDDEPITLTLTEFRLLEYFMAHEGQALSRQDIIDHVWDFAANPLSRAVDVHINNLRNKLNSHDDTIQLETVRGIGYRLRG